MKPNRVCENVAENKNRLGCYLELVQHEEKVEQAYYDMMERYKFHDEEMENGKLFFNNKVIEKTKIHELKIGIESRRIFWSDQRLVSPLKIQNVYSGKMVRFNESRF